MIMANSQTTSVCLVCSSNTNNINNDLNFNSEVLSNFLSIVPRYLSYGHSSFNNDKIHQFLTIHKSPRFGLIKCCDICVEQLKKFLDVYDGFELIQLELLNILDRISTLILKSCSENNPKQISDFQVAFTNLVEEKRTKHFPVVKIKRLQSSNIKNESINLSENETGLPWSVNHLKREPSPFEDDHTDFEDFYPDSNFEASSPKDLPESLENKTKPITLTVNIKIEDDADCHDHEEEVPSAKDPRSPNHQKVARKSLPTFTKRRVKDKFTCLFCSENHRNRFALFRHLRRHTEELPVHCKQCSHESRDRHGLRKHVIEGHYTDDGTGGNEPDAVKDKRCPICGKLFSTNASVRMHISYIHTKVKNFKCGHENCSKAFVRRSDLNKHLVAHTDLKPFKCIFCHKRFKRRLEVTRHTLFMHGDETGKKGMHACSVCGKVCKEMSKLRIHRARNHPDIFKDDRESLMKFKCPHAPCGRRFFTGYDMKKHINVHHKHDAEVL